MQLAIATILAIVKAVPIIDEWMKRLTIEYHNWKKSQNDEAYNAAMGITRTGDTTDLQSSLSKLLDNE